MFSDKEMAISFLSEMLPSDVVELLEFDTLTYNDKSYITAELEEIFSDMVMDIDLKTGSKLKVCILLEHKSYVDPNVTIQILRYLGEAYNKQLASKEILRPILPVLYYHGKNGILNSLKANFYLFLMLSENTYHCTLVSS